MQAIVTKNKVRLLRKSTAFGNWLQKSNLRTAAAALWRVKIETMAPALAAALLFLLTFQALAQPTVAQVLSRVSEEAEVLAQNAPKILTTETLEQRSVMPPSRFRPRAGSEAERASGQRMRVREIVSEYTYGALRESASANLIEFRQVTSVDGRKVQSPESARRALSQGIQAADDRIRKRMLEDFAKNGLVDVATDYALILLTFTRRGLEQLDIAPLGRDQVGADAALTLSWKQKSAEAGALEFHGGESVRLPLQGILWVRAYDGLPLRIKAWMEYTDKAKQDIRDEATIDYAMSAHGFLTPVAVVHRHLVNHVMMTENLYRYDPFKLFTTSTEIKFGDVAPTPAAPPVKK